MLNTNKINHSGSKNRIFIYLSHLKWTEKHLHSFVLCDQNNIQAFHPGEVEPLHLDARKNTENKSNNVLGYVEETDIMSD